MYDAIDDPYTYENSTVLVNKLGLLEQTELDAFEAEISSARADEMLPEGNLDFEYYKAVHHHLFQDVYEWAGNASGVAALVFPQSGMARASPFAVIARSEATKQSSFATVKLDCFAEPVIGRRFAPSRWLAMTVSKSAI